MPYLPQRSARGPVGQLGAGRITVGCGTLHALPVGFERQECFLMLTVPRTRRPLNRIWVGLDEIPQPPGF